METCLCPRCPGHIIRVMPRDFFDLTPEEPNVVLILDRTRIMKENFLRSDRQKPNPGPIGRDCVLPISNGRTRRTNSKRLWAQLHHFLSLLLSKHPLTC